MATKYDCYKIIQGNYGYGWDDEDAHACNSGGHIADDKARALLRENLKAYRVNGGGQYRVIFRRELKPSEVQP